MTARIMALFKQLPLTAYLVTALLSAGAGWLALNNAHQRQLGAERTLTAQARAQRDSALVDVKRLTTALKPQAVAAARTRVKWDTVKAGLDTAWLHDTSPVPVEVVRTVVRANRLR